MAITVKEIAQLAGVSRGTVDRALKNREGINPKTKQRILEIAKEYDYKPSIIGKALVYSKRSIKVSVILNSVGNEFFDEIKRGIFDAVNEYSSYGIEVELVEFKGYDSKDLLKKIEAIDSDTRALILTPINDEAVEKKINELAADGMCVITLSSDIKESDRLAYVGCDYYKSGCVAGRLIQLAADKNAHLCIVTGSVHHVGHQQRVTGLKDYITKKCSDIVISSVVENQDDDDISYAQTIKTLKNDESIDFVYVTAGGVMGTVRAIKEINEKQNRHIKACCFAATPSIVEAVLGGDIEATICQQPYEQGFTSVKLVFEHIVAKNEVKEFNYSDLIIKVDQSI